MTSSRFGPHQMDFFLSSFPRFKNECRESQKIDGTGNQKFLRKNEMLSGQHVLRELVDGCDVGQGEASIPRPDQIWTKDDRQV